jgi:hypothetical protein
LLLIQYFEVSMNASFVQALPTCEALPQLTLVGSTQPPDRHCVLPEQA